MLTLAITPVSSASAVGEDILAGYHDNTLVCLNQVTRATCHIWIGNVWKPGDRNYFVMWDRGQQTEMPTVGGNYRLEGREGSFELRDGRICLTPKPVPQKQFRTDVDGELYMGAGCYDIAARKPGDRWTQRDARGREVTFWLLQGR